MRTGGYNSGSTHRDMPPHLSRRRVFHLNLHFKKSLIVTNKTKTCSGEEEESGQTEVSNRTRALQMPKHMAASPRAFWDSRPLRFTGQALVGARAGRRQEEVRSSGLGLQRIETFPWRIWISPEASLGYKTSNFNPQPQLE